MNQTDIRGEKELIANEIARLQMLIEKARVELEYLQQKCKHPKAYERWLMGKEKGKVCPDCR